ncbi:MAG: GNAT family N-acetyltransferase [Candidatus Zixiibacteriota bacterium]
MIYKEKIDGITEDRLQGFFVGWPNPPTPDTLLEILHNSSHIVLAIDNETGIVVGIITAVSDNVISAYIPLLEVLPEYQGRGIGGELMRLMMKKLEGLYMIDLICDKDKVAFYEKFGLKSASKFGVEAMIERNFAAQSGRKES